MLTEPVDAVLTRRITLTTPDPIENAADILAARCPTDSVILRLPSTLCPRWQLNDVSELHAVRSHAVLPALNCSECVASPNPAPSTVTLADPVDPRLLMRKIPLIHALSVDSPPLTLPTRTPLLTVTRLLPDTPCPPWHCTEVSESQLLLSHALRPSRIASL